jgi:hypothetical protein
MHAKPDVRAMRARAQRANMRVEGEKFAKLLKFAKLDAKLFEHNFFYFTKNKLMSN